MNNHQPIIDLGYQASINQDQANFWYKHPKFNGFLVVPKHKIFVDMMDFINFIYELGQKNGYLAAKGQIAGRLTEFIVGMDKE